MTPKTVRLSQHALQNAEYRGTTPNEITNAILTSKWSPAERGRLECRRDYPYNGIWSGKYYRTKQVRPVFVEEPDEVVVVTVYVYYF